MYLIFSLKKVSNNNTVIRVNKGNTLFIVKRVFGEISLKREKRIRKL